MKLQSLFRMIARLFSPAAARLEAGIPGWSPAGLWGPGGATGVGIGRAAAVGLGGALVGGGETVAVGVGGATRVAVGVGSAGVGVGRGVAVEVGSGVEVAVGVGSTGVGEGEVVGVAETSGTAVASACRCAWGGDGWVGPVQPRSTMARNTSPGHANVTGCRLVTAPMTDVAPSCGRAASVAVSRPALHGRFSIWGAQTSLGWRGCPASRRAPPPNSGLVGERGQIRSYRLHILRG